MQTALKTVDKAITQHLGRRLSTPEKTVVEGAWQKIGYKEMERTSDFSRNYLMRDVAPRLWKLLSHVFGEPVNKHNFRSIVENLPANKLHSPAPLPRQAVFPRKLEQSGERVTSSQNNEAKNISSSKLNSDFKSDTEQLVPRSWVKSQPWENITKVNFVGRSRELNTLKEWIIDDRVPVVSLLGITGIGKTTLCQKFIQLHQAHFDCIVWQEILKPISLSESIERLTDKVSYLLKISDRYEDKLGQLLTIMRASRCLIVVDEAKFSISSDRSSPNERELWQKIALEPHQSCLLINSSRNIPGISLFEEEKLLVRSLLLSGFTLEEAQLFLAIDAKQQSWNKLIKIYQGHPLALKTAKKTIQNIFNGNAAEFVAQKAFVFGEIEETLDKLFASLSTLETEILYWLTIESKPISLDLILKNINSVTSAQIIEGLVSLEKRGLLETAQIETQSLFTVGSIIKVYISKKLIAKISSYSKYHAESNLDTIEDIIDLSAPATTEKTNLSNWLRGNFEADWQPIEILLNTEHLTSRLRGAYYLEAKKSLKRCKLITIGENQLVVLLEVKPNSEQNISIRVQLYPAVGKSVLPPDLELSLIDDLGKSLRKVVARDADNFIQLPLFRGKPLEKFSIKVALLQLFMKEDFII